MCDSACVALEQLLYTPAFCSPSFPQCVHISNCYSHVFIVYSHEFPAAWHHETFRVCLETCLETALERQDLSRAYLAHHELDGDTIFVVVIAVIIVFIITISIIISIIHINC